MTAKAPPQQASDFLALAERCEQATGPDRKLDYAISEAVGRGCVRSPKPLREDYAEETGGFTIPRYTASLDASMTLVPEGWEFIRLEKQRSWPDDPRGNCWLLEAVMMEPHGKGHSRASAMTGPLALCAAALRARAAQ